MPLDFPSSPTNGDIYGNYYYDSSTGAWRSLSSTVNPIPSTLKNLTISSTETTGVSLKITPFTTSSVNLQEWYNTSSNVVASINVAGDLNVNSLTLSTDLSVPNGGTGAASFLDNTYLKGNGVLPITGQSGIPAGDITSGTLDVVRGGTGAATLTSGGYLKGAGTGAITSQVGIPAGDITSGKLGYGIVPTGSVLQVLSKTDTTAYSSGVTATTWYTWPSSRLALAITPKFTTSKILIMVNVSLGNASNDAAFRITRGGSAISIGDAAGSRPRATGLTGMLYAADQNHTVRMVTTTFLDSPATTAATTYNVDYMSEGTTMYLNRVASYPDAATTYAATVTSTITLMEIAG